MSPAEPPDRRKALSDIDELRRNHGGTDSLRNYGGADSLRGGHGGTKEEHENYGANREYDSRNATGISGYEGLVMEMMN